MDKIKLNKACDYVVKEYFKGIPVKDGIKAAKKKFNIRLNMADILMGW